MRTAIEITMADQVSGLMRWWNDAGVDVMIDEQPRRWLAVAAASPGRPAMVVKPPVVPPPAEKPKSLEALVEWLMTSDDIAEVGPARRRVPPAGDATCGLMVLTDLPETADVDSGVLFAGALSPLFEKMLGALGKDRDSIYLASISAGRPPSGKLSENALKILAETARDHVRMVSPRQLWVIGSAASCAILGMTDVQAHGKLHSINLNGAIIDVVATAHPRILTNRDQKARAWENMKKLIEKDDV